MGYSQWSFNSLINYTERHSNFKILFSTTWSHHLFCDNRGHPSADVIDAHKCPSRILPRAHRGRWPMCAALLMCITAVTLQDDIIRSDGFKHILSSHSTLLYLSPWWPQVQLRQISNTHLWLRHCVHTCVITEHYRDLNQGSRPNFRNSPKGWKNNT